MLSKLSKRVALLLVLVLATSARADDLARELAQRAGQNVDLSKDATLKGELVAAGLVPEDATLVYVSSALLEKAQARGRFENHVNGTRYHVGDRLLVKDPGSGGTYSPRAEIEDVKSDGTYAVNVWNKVVTGTAGWFGRIDPFTGRSASGAATPWLDRDNVRSVTMTQKQIDDLNGRVEAHGPYSVNGWRIDPKTDPVLAERITKAEAAAERLFPAGSLTLPVDAAARSAKLEELSKLQEKFLDEVFKDNFINHPGNDSQANDRMAAYIAQHPDMRGKIGAVLASQCGVCTDQAAAMVAILNAVGSRIGLTARAISGPTIKENAGHGFVMLRFLDGKLGMYDVTWHFQNERDAVDNMDFATWAGIPHSNRRINSLDQATTDPTAFVDRSSELGRDLYRGYTQAEAETLLATRTAELASTKALSLDDAASAVLSGNAGENKLAGTFDVAAIVAQARSAQAPAPGALVTGAPARTPGFLDRLPIPDTLKDRVRAAAGIDVADDAR